MNAGGIIHAADIIWPEATDLIIDALLGTGIAQAPREQCVYIRYAMFVMVIGGVIAAINPKNIVLKLIGCIAAFYGS
ncbi:disulfide bond formation protein B, partial [Salmonella enterica subsp. enterica serovar Kentucky]|nr:disulfide bond formation protein B [Salmonella enterica subsp. enterica serovar Kentucky]